MGKLTKSVAPNETVAWQQSLRQAAFDAISEQDVKEIFTGVVKRAKEGDAAAIKIVCEYLLGGRAAPNVVVNNPVQVNQQLAAQPAVEPYDRFGRNGYSEG